MGAGARPDAAAIAAALTRHHPDADTELHFRNAFELLVATVLSAQSTDRRVNEVTPALFARYPDPAALAVAPAAEVEGLIHSTGFFRQKAKAIIGLSAALVDGHGGRVPADMDALVALPGVGRKTANVVLGHALGVPGFPVDRHVLRVAGRLGLIHTDDPVKAELVLTAHFPAADWTRVSDLLILHGRRVCGPTPSCDECHARPLCPHAATGGRTARPGAAAAALPAHRRPLASPPAKRTTPVKATKVTTPKKSTTADRRGVEPAATRRRGR